MTIIIYTKEDCSYCKLAKTLLKERGMEFSEVLVGGPDYSVENFKDEFAAHGIKTVPQIFVDDRRVGGYFDLVAWLDQKDENEAMDRGG